MSDEEQSSTHYSSLITSGHFESLAFLLGELLLDLVQFGLPVLESNRQPFGLLAKVTVGVARGEVLINADGLGHLAGGFTSLGGAKETLLDQNRRRFEVACQLLEGTGRALEALDGLVAVDVNRRHAGLQIF